ncbi:MAG: hypothetical protein AAGJ32_02485 [Pseudomonadota bacterium]
MDIVYLASAVTLPGSPTRRSDAYEHDQMMDALEGPLASEGLGLSAVRWDAEGVDWSRYGAAIIGTTWDYWDRQEQFLSTLEGIERQTRLLNPSKLVRWNSHKGYLRDLAAQGARTISTLWVDHPTEEAVATGFETLGSADVVWKRQVGAGAAGQHRLTPGDPVPDMPHAMMAQPFLPAIQTEGELSFIFIDGAFCHALMKRAAEGDYRIQSSYGGAETAVDPSADDLAAAKSILGLLDAPPLYARVDMLRADDGGLLLMELELIEPFLYPLQGPDLGPRMAAALERRLKR